MTPVNFAQAFLAALHLPASDNNVRALVAIQAQEGGYIHNGAAFNPLNTSQVMPGSRGVIQLAPKVFIQAYTDWKQGLAATVKTITNTQFDYKGILAALARSASPEETLYAFAVSDWGWYKLVNGKRVPVAYPEALAELHSPHYGNLTFPDGGGLLDTGRRAIKELFEPSPKTKTAAMSGAVVLVGVALLGGLALLAYGLRKDSKDS